MNTQDDDPFPPLSPNGEPAAPPDSAFLKNCLSSLYKLKAIGRVEPVSHCLSENSQWGVVLRIDFTIDGVQTPGRQNRALFWKAKNGTISEIIAIGQTIPPLDLGDAKLSSSGIR